MRITCAANNCQGYLPGNYKLYWSQVWDPLRSRNEAAFMWFIWHKVVAINEWRAYIALVSISKQCVFCLLNTNESIKHKFWGCIQPRRAWRWAMFTMHELCGVRIGNHDSLKWKQACLGNKSLRNTVEIIKIWHLLGGITLWTIPIECNNKVFNCEQWHESKVKHHIWDELIIYAKAAWESVSEEIFGHNQLRS